MLYWQDMWLPHSRFIVEELQKEPLDRKIVVVGPARRSSAAAIFTVAGKAKSSVEGGKAERTKSYRWRETACTFSEWRRLIKRHRPDVIVVADEAMSLNVLLAALANWMYGKGIVLFYGFENIKQGVGWPSFFRAPSFDRLRSCLVKTLRFLLLDQMVMPVRRRLVAGGLVSYEECAEVIYAHGWNPPMAQQWWPVDGRVFVAAGARADFGLSASFVVGFVGRFVAEKGIDYLLDAMARLDERFGIVMIGDGPQRLALERRVAQLGLGKRARILSPQDSETLATSYRAMDLLVLPSISTSTWKEQYGRVLMEARACGTRIAGSNSGAIPFVVGDPEMVFPEGDVSAIVRTICRAADRESARTVVAEVPGPGEFLRAWLSLADGCLAHVRGMVNAE